jgi:hypothetical protein
MEYLRKAFHSGVSGFKAMTIQVVTLMWLRTIMNYQYKNGTTIKNTVNILYSQGGIRRFYSGILPALIQGPVSRFGDTFANTLALETFKNKNLPIFVQTAAASVTAGCARVFLTPIDTLKTMSQVQGKEARTILGKKIKSSGPSVLYHGAIANGLATLIGHYPWFVTHNYLNNYLPKYKEKGKKLLRNAFIGFTCSIISDTSSNFMRVIKTTRQTSESTTSYRQLVMNIYHKDGLYSLFFRGLGVRLFTNGIQGLLFNVLWKYFDSK